MIRMVTWICRKEVDLMKQYDVECPVCGFLNRNLYLEETDGWMECGHCGSLSQHCKVIKMVQLDAFRTEDAEKSMAKAAI